MSNTDSLDLEIAHYDVSTLYGMFKLQRPCDSGGGSGGSGGLITPADVELRECELKEQLLQSGHVEPRFKRRLVHFLSAARAMLVADLCGETKRLHRWAQAREEPATRVTHTQAFPLHRDVDPHRLKWLTTNVNVDTRAVVLLPANAGSTQHPQQQLSRNKG